MSGEFVPCVTISLSEFDRMRDAARRGEDAQRRLNALLKDAIKRVDETAGEFNKNDYWRGRMYEASSLRVLVAQAAKQPQAPSTPEVSND